ncbi:MAG: ATP-binding protein [Symploca sp. SIO2C1]|nr:ATP-binding protein [Symploca sp. SIO2C1]
MKDSHKYIKQFPSDLKALDQILSWFDQLSQPYIPRKVCLQCQLALAEGFTNAVRHAHKDLSGDLSVDIEVTIAPQCLELRIWDWGPPFDLEGRIRQLERRVDRESPGGRGLLILQKISDRLSYTRTDDNRNCLLVAKSY